MAFSEARTVEQPILDWLGELGWKYVPPDALSRETEEPFDLPTLKDAIRRLNPAAVQSEEDVEKVVGQLRRLSNDLNGNREFFQWLKGEKSIVFRQGEKAQTVRLLDVESIDNNFFVATNQFRFSGYENVRFDIVLMVNGLPLVVVEAKAPGRQLLDYHEGIKQIQRYNRVAPQFFKYLAFTCATDGISFKYDWLGEDRFYGWMGRELYDPVENPVKAIFRKEFFVDFITNFIVFEEDREKVRKKIAMWQQVSATNKIVKRVLQGEPKGGLVWHTQGSGKTLTMLFAAWKLKKEPKLNNPTILVIVDRIELESQMMGTFSNVQFPYTTEASSTKDLIDKLKKDSREVIITTIQKFEDVKEVLSQRENLIIFVDEAHRTQYGKLAMKMRKAFPNAFIFGFTGTPIEKGPMGKSTFRAFCPPGELYLDKYGIKQSISDGATVRLLYQQRMADYQVDAKTLDREFFEVTKDLSDEEEEEVLQRSVTLKNAMKSKDRIDKIARDVAEHYRTYIEPNGFKAQLVAVDREACALYKEALDRYLPPEYSAVIYTPHPNDDDLLRKYHMKKEEQLNIARNTFQKADTLPKIIIVTDMLLTGFDAPIEQVMYLDKPLRDHKLLQAIARTNRPHPKKEAGIVIDYVGIFRKLVKALNFEEQDIEGVAYDFDLLRREFRQTMAEVLEIFSGIERKGGREDLLRCMDVLEEPANLKKFKEGLSRLKALYETLAPDPAIFDLLDDYSWLLSVNITYNQWVNREKPDLSIYEAKTKQLIMDRLLVGQVERLIPTIEINEDYLKIVDREYKSEDDRIREMKRALHYHIRLNAESNPAYETLAQRLEEILKEHDKSAQLRDLTELVNDVVRLQKRRREMGVSEEEFAVVEAIRKYTDMDDKSLKAFVKETMKKVKDKVFPGWQRKVKIVNEVEETIFNECFAHFSKELGPRDTSRMSDEIVRIVARFSSW
jgi:type I restriction enzyme R subunit